MGLTGFAQPTDLEQAMLDVWSLSETGQAGCAVPSVG
jgi:glutamate dehydrogenase